MSAQRDRPVVRGEDARRFLENEQRVNNEIEQAKEAAIRRDERERIAAVLAHMGKCPPVECGDGCFACWREYLTSEE